MGPPCGVVGGGDPHPLAPCLASSFFGHRFDCTVRRPLQLGHLAWARAWPFPAEHPSAGHLCLSVRCFSAQRTQRASWGTAERRFGIGTAGAAMTVVGRLVQL